MSDNMRVGDFFLVLFFACFLVFESKCDFFNIKLCGTKTRQIQIVKGIIRIS